MTTEVARSPHIEAQLRAAYRTQYRTVADQLAVADEPTTVAEAEQCAALLAQLHRLRNQIVGTFVQDDEIRVKLETHIQRGTILGRSQYLTLILYRSPKGELLHAEADRVFAFDERMG